MGQAHPLAESLGLPYGNNLMPNKIDDAMESMYRNLEEKTGKSLDQWIKIARTTQMTKHGEIVKFLKTKYNLGHGYANTITLKALAAGESSGDDLVNAQYMGDKAALRPIYDSLIAAVGKFGGDVEISPKKTYVSLRRNKQFAIVQASTTARVDVGINLKGVKPAGRLEASGSFNSMVSHRVRLDSVKDVDQELIGWLESAYDGA